MTTIGALDLVRSPWTRGGFLLAALAAAGLAVFSREEEVRTALSDYPWVVLLEAAMLSAIYMVASMLVWRALIRDAGSPLSLREASTVFFVSQLGKYLPGGIWSMLAAAELGTDYKISRRRSVSIMLVALLIALATGLAIASIALPLLPEDPRQPRYTWLALALPVFVAVLVPPILNRIVGTTLRILQRPPMESELTTRGILSASAWCLLAWLVAGIQVWLLAANAGLEATLASFGLVTGGFALAWAAGLLFVVAPAGVGVREAVLATTLAAQLDPGAVVTVVLLSRLLMTLGDVLCGLGALAAARGLRSNRVGSEY